jgi:hypothetical protein
MRSNNRNLGATTTVSRRPALRSTRAGATSRWLLKKLYEGAGPPPIRLSLWDGTEVGASDRDALARVRIHNLGTLLRLLAHPDLYFGEAYMSGELEVEGIWSPSWRRSTGRGLGSGAWASGTASPMAS